MINTKKRLRILITGGTGFIGSYAVKYYVNQQYVVRVLLRKKSAEKVKNIASDVELAYGDMRNRKSLLDATRNVDYVVNFAALKSDEKDSYDVNVKGVEYLIEAAKKNKVSKIIQISTISTKIKNLGIYGKTKAEADKLLLKNDVPVVILRPSIVYGDLKNGVFGSLVKASDLPVVPMFGDGTCYFYPIHVEDLIKATEIAVLDKKLNNKKYDVGGPDKIAFNALVNLLAKKRRKTPHIIHVPSLFGIITATLLSKIMYRPPITVSNILGSTQKVHIDVQTFFRDFDFKPRSLQQGLSKLFSESEKQYKEAKVFFAYILLEKYRGNINNDVYKRYNMAIQKNGLAYYKSIPSYFFYILHPLDAFSKVFFPKSLLQKKLLIASALIETTPYSADWLLPRKYATSRVILIILKLFITTTVNFSLGFLLYLVPGLYKKYVQ